MASTEQAIFHDLFGMSCEVSGPLARSGAGRKIRGLDLSESLTAKQVEFLLNCLAKHRILTIAEQDLNRFGLTQLERFACHWGAPVPHPSNFLRDGKLATSNGKTSGAVEYLPMDKRLASRVNRRFPGKLTCLPHSSPAVLVVSNFSGDPPDNQNQQTPHIRPGGSWHTDIEYEPEPICVSMFLIHQVPASRNSSSNTWVTQSESSQAMSKVRLEGSSDELIERRTSLPLNGETAYADTKAAFESLPEAKRNSLRTIRVRRRLNESDPGWLAPLVRVNPRSGNESLHSPIWASRPGVRPAIEVEGLNASDSREFLDELECHVLQDAFRYDHVHEQGDVTIWDNYQTLHTSPSTKTNIKQLEDARLFYRISCKGTPATQLPRRDSRAWTKTSIPGAYISPEGAS